MCVCFIINVSHLGEINAYSGYKFCTEVEVVFVSV